jgi:hypothetical protein
LDVFNFLASKGKPLAKGEASVSVICKPFATMGPVAMKPCRLADDAIDKRKDVNALVNMIVFGEFNL